MAGFDILFITVIFVLAGIVKGVVGLGMPTISLALLALILPLPEAIAVTLIPTIATNVWQGAMGGYFAKTLRRLWPMLVALSITVWFGTALLSQANPGVILGVLGFLLAIYATYSLLGLRVTIPARHETTLSAASGLASGFITGMTGSFTVPGVLYLQALGLPRDHLVQAMGIMFTACTLVLWLAMAWNGLLSKELNTLSAAALIPAGIGMVVGQKVRRHLSEAKFRKVFFTALLALGLFLVGRAGLSFL